jgi:DNA primase/KaiC/GvpD/RAD55 family RecA-like ATPase
MSIHSNTEQWQEEAYTLMYGEIPRIFPQLEFEHQGNKWVSAKHIDGTDSSKKVKTVIKAQTPGIMFTNDEGQQTHNVIKVYADLNGLEMWKARKQIAEIIGLELPNNPRTVIHQKRQDILAETQAYFKYCLYNSTNGAAVLKYFTDVRKWKPEEIESAEIGVIPSQAQLKDRLIKSGYNESDINEALKLHPAIGVSHIITIPRNSYGAIKDFNFRCISDAPEGLQKYLRQTNDKNQTRTLTYLPWKHDGDLILVEGELDALRAQVNGLTNVVSIGSQNVSESQLTHAKERGFNKISICLDNEPSKEAKKAAAIEAIATQAEKLGFSVYVIHLPSLNDVKTDLDTYLNDHTAQQFKDLATSPNPAEMQNIHTWRVFELCKKYEGKDISDKDKEDILNGIVKIGLGVSAVLRNDYYQQVNNLIGDIIPIDEAAIEAAIERIKKATKLEEQRINYLDTTARIQTQLKEGKITINEAADATSKLTQSIKETGIDYDRYLTPTNWDAQIKAALAQPEGLETGYYTTDDTDKRASATQEGKPNKCKLLLPAKAVTVVAGRSGHGKTMYMLNLAMQVILHQPGQRFYYFTYEMPEDQLLLRALNTYVGITVGEVSAYQASALYAVFTKNDYQYIKEAKREATRRAVSEFRAIIDNGQLVLREVMGVPVEDLAGIVKMIHKQGQIHGLFIDYIQRINSKKVTKAGGIDTLKQVSNVFNEIANETGLPIITGAQFNREVQHIADISEYSLREADDITHMAALILGIWNNNYALTDRKTPRNGNDPEADEYNNKKKEYHIPGTIYSKVIKYRFGEIGAEYLLTYNANTQTLDNTQFQTRSTKA